MPRYIAFLRGINVGGHRVKMARLRGLFEDLGFADVSTFIASGNVLFSVQSNDVDGLRDRIERHLARALGYQVATFIRTPAQLAAIAASGVTEAGAEGRFRSSHHVIFMHGPAPQSLRSELAGLESGTDDFRFSESEIHWRIRGKLTDSPHLWRRTGSSAPGRPHDRTEHEHASTHRREGETSGSNLAQVSRPTITASTPPASRSARSRSSDRPSAPRSATRRRARDRRARTSPPARAPRRRACRRRRRRT